MRHSYDEDGFIDLDALISTYWGKGAVNPYSKGQPTAILDLELTKNPEGGQALRID